MAAAAEALATAQQLAPSDPRVLQLLGETQNKPSARPSAAHFVGAGDTKHYPNHQSGDGSDPDASESFTKPTSLSSPGAPMRTSGPRAPEHRDPTPSPQVPPEPKSNRGAALKAGKPTAAKWVTVPNRRKHPDQPRWGPRKRP